MRFKKNKIMNIVIPLIKKRIIKILLLVVSIYFVYRIIMFLSLLIFPLPEILTNDFSESYYYNDDTVAWINLNNNDQYRTYAELNNVSEYLVKGIVEYEDKYFYFHPGFNPASIIRAFYYNFKEKRVVSGGSTITMQLARLSEPKKRNIFNKFIELLRALQIENRYSKKKILEMYLNIIPMGGNIQGVKSASYLYFNKKPDDLTFLESSLIIGISNSPERNRPDKFKNNALINRNKVCSRIYKKFNIENDELQEILTASYSPYRLNFKNDIIPLIMRFDKLPYKKERKFTIDKNLQRMSLNILKKQMELLESYNGAVIIVDNNSMNVLTYIGSPYYNLNINSVKYNACNVLRSPGSTLKPFIYAKAIENGIITQKKKIFDVPEDFYGYKPKNFSNKYDGILSADEALIRSLNIPAVYLSQSLKDEGIKDLFKKCGYWNKASKIEDEDLSIALGSYPMTLEQMVVLYSALANKGKINNINFFQNNNIKTQKQILSEESCFIISEILSEVYRPDLPVSWEFTKDKPRVAFKTGTSYGFVDSWSIGYTPDYTIGVWIGKLDNRFTKVLTGINAAAPVLFDIMNELERKNDNWFEKPEGVESRKICAVSGMVPNKYCKHQLDEYYIPKFSDNTVCDVHKRVIMDVKNNKIIALKDIKEDGDYEEKIIEIWDEKIEYFLKKMGKKDLSLIDGNFTDIYNNKKIKILSPIYNVKYVIDLNKNIINQKIPLKGFEYPDSKKFYWYADGKLLGEVDSGESLYFLPDKNEIKITVTDEAGRTGSTVLKVDIIKNNI